MPSITKNSDQTKNHRGRVRNKYSKLLSFDSYEPYEVLVGHLAAAQVKALKNLPGVSRDDLAAVFLGQFDTQSAFAGCVGAGDDDHFGQIFLIHSCLLHQWSVGAL